MSKRLTFLILSGPTREYIDPVRYISNESSGKMGVALAQAVLKRGHKIIFISGPAAFLPKNVRLIKIVTALEMFKEVKANFRKADIIISVAAISDYRPYKTYKRKIKKDNSKIFSIEFKQNPDIIKYCGKNKSNQVVVGFALETENLIKNASIKLKSKNLDLIVSNGTKSFELDVINVNIISDNSVIEIKDKKKNIIARRIINETIRIYRNIKTYKNDS
ncbi:MAG: phosphopantothenoylcysteine decarboxylase [Endomicrobium sp.]|jgi:phosphopantothenoylcysteine synthetase/decarboxylase|nr:phosphopantothenoylcysteine decarboxylase [Endomicrobium sp.]